MRIDPRRDVVVLGDELPYEDGAEARILEILETVGDRSSTSDELASHISDWPTRYHFSRLRRNLFEPFKFESGMRILEIGCGTGANLSALAESGAEVVGVEGSLTRARAARVRTLGYDNVTVYGGDVTDLPALEPFDVVALIGVLEYSPAGSGGAHGPIALLEMARSLLRDDGALVLAIENQIGLKYLLSHPEDHLGMPWLGVEGYPDRGRPRTWSRAVLAGMLADVGLVDQSWLYPYPDYKLPTFIARHRLFDTPSGRQVLGQFLRSPVSDHAGVPTFVCDAQRAFGVMLDAEVGPDTANSFLVVASAQPGRADGLLGEGEAWISSGERLQEFRSQRVIEKEQSGYALVQRSGPQRANSAQVSWLNNIGHDHQPIHLGICMEDEVLQAIREDDIDTLSRALVAFDRFLADHRVGSSPVPMHPFATDAEGPVLPGEFLDCTFKNLIRDENSSLHYVDREWDVPGGVDEELIRFRAYVEISIRVAMAGIRHRWNPLMTIGDLAQSLRRLVGDGWTEDLTGRFARAEDELQRLVSGRSPGGSVEELLGSKLVDFVPNLSTLSLIRRLEGSEHVRGALLALQEEHHELQLAHHELQLAHHELQLAHHELSLAHHELQLAHHELQLAHHDTELRRRAAQSELSFVTSERDALRSLQEGTEHARQSLANEVDALHRSRSYRLGHMLTAPLRSLR